MARARNLKPSFFTDDELAELPPLARILFAGLWCYADRSGRLEDRPKRIKAEVLPYDQCDSDALLARLHTAGFILRYRVDGQAFIQVVAFSKHQNPHVKEPESTIPAPDSPGAVTGNSGIGPADSLNPLPLTLNPQPSTPAKPGRAPTEHPGFDHFWQTWPSTDRKIDKAKCREHWLKHRLESKASHIVAHVASMKLTAKWRPNAQGESFEPCPLTYLRGSRWDDGIPERNKAASTLSAVGQQSADSINAWLEREERNGTHGP